MELNKVWDGFRAIVFGCGLLQVPSMPKLENVLLVDELKVNLISIVNHVIKICLLNSPKTSV